MVEYEEMGNSMKQNDALSQRSFFHKTDWLAVVLILAVSLGLWAVLFFPRVTQRLQVEIYCDNVLTQTIPLPAEDKLLELSDRQMTLELKDNRIRVSETNCADQSCLSRPDDRLPAKPCGCADYGKWRTGFPDRRNRGLSTIRRRD